VTSTFVRKKEGEEATTQVWLGSIDRRKQTGEEEYCLGPYRVVNSGEASAHLIRESWKGNERREIYEAFTKEDTARKKENCRGKCGQLEYVW